MFGYKTHLILGELALQGINIPYLERNGYELSSCKYSFMKNTDYKGEVISSSQGGSIHISISSLPDDELLRWSINPRMYKDGAIIISNSEGVAIEKVFFNYTACVSLDISYINNSKQNFNTTITLSANKLIFGKTMFDNNWKNT